MIANTPIPHLEFVLGKMHTVHLTDDGMVIHHQDSTQSVAWDDLVAVVIRNKNFDFEVRLRNGEAIRFRKPRLYNNFSDAYDALKFELDYQLVQRRLPKLMADLAQGATLQFGPLTIDQTGLHTADQHLAWDGFSCLAPEFKTRRGKVFIFRHASERLWQAFAWHELPNLTLLFNLLERISHARLWEFEWDISKAEAALSTITTGIQRNLHFRDDGRRLYPDPVASLMACVIFSPLVMIVAYPFAALINPELSNNDLIATWIFSLICVAPMLGSMLFEMVIKNLWEVWRTSAREVEITPEQIHIITARGKTVVFRWEELSLGDTAVFFDREVWLLDHILVAWDSVSVAPLEEIDPDLSYSIDDHLSPELRMLVRKAILYTLLPLKMAQVESGREIPGDVWNRYYTINHNGIYQYDHFASWEDLRRQATPYFMNLPEWAMLKRDHWFASTYYAVVRYYLYNQTGRVQ